MPLGKISCCLAPAARWVTVGVLAFGLSACAEPRLPGPPEAEVEGIAVLGIPNARFWSDRDPEKVVQEAALANARADAIDPGSRSSPIAFLALSGGGEHGAFGAGLLCGWTETGQRPNFRLVTGVSTGALIAPFAFLGPAYDDDLRALYTGISPGDIYRSRTIMAAVLSDALSDSAPLSALISRVINQPMVAEIGREYRKGRMLFVGTTNLDLQRPVLWNIGAIAASGKPGSMELIHKILLASAAVPGLFPPVLINVEINGRTYQEMHVDGGTVEQMFLYPANLRLAQEAERLHIQRDRTAYVIRDARLDAEPEDTSREFRTIAERAIQTMIRSSGINDTFRIYATTLRDGVAFRLAFIGSDFPRTPHEEFSRAYMNALFDYAYQKARNGYPWATVPPGFTISTPAPQPR